MPTLYDLPIEAMEIETVLAEGCGELTPELEQRISEFMRAGKDKMEAAAMVVRSLEGDAQVCLAEAQRLKDRAAGLQKGVDALKSLMRFVLDEAFGGKIKTAKFTIWAQTSATTIGFELLPETNISEFASLFPHLVRIPEPELDKKALKVARDAGLDIPPNVAVIENPGTRFLRIK